MQHAFPDPSGATDEQLQYLCDATAAIVTTNPDCTDIEDPRAYFLTALFALNGIGAAVLAGRTDAAIEDELGQLTGDEDA